MICATHAAPYRITPRKGAGFSAWTFAAPGTEPELVQIVLPRDEGVFRVAVVRRVWVGRETGHPGGVHCSACPPGCDVDRDGDRSATEDISQRTADGAVCLHTATCSGCDRIEADALRQHIAQLYCACISRSLVG